MCGIKYAKKADARNTADFVRIVHEKMKVSILHVMYQMRKLKTCFITLGEVTDGVGHSLLKP